MRHFHAQVRLMGNHGLSAGVPWLSDTDCLKCFVCKNGIEDAGHFLLTACSSEKTSLFYGLT